MCILTHQIRDDYIIFVELKPATIILSKTNFTKYVSSQQSNIIQEIIRSSPWSFVLRLVHKYKKVHNQSVEALIFQACVTNTNKKDQI